MSVWRAVVGSQSKLKDLTQYARGRIQPGLQVGDKVDKKMEFHQGGKNSSQTMTGTINNP